MKIIGIHDGHNSSVAVIDDRKVVAAVQEERLSRVKNQGGTPVHALHEVMQLSNIRSIEEIDCVVVSSRISQPPYFERKDVLDDYARMSQYSVSRRGRLRAGLADIDMIRRVRKAIHHDSAVADAQRLRVEELVEVGVPPPKIGFIDHHTAHAACAYYGLAHYSDQVLVLTNDGAGDGVCASVNIGYHGKLERLCSIGEDHSLATIYAMITYLMGMVPLEHEYKVMGLAPYHRGSIEHNSIFQGLYELFEWDSKNPLQWHRRRGVPRVGYLWQYLERLIRRTRFDTVAAGLQAFTESFLVEWVRRCVRETGISRVALSGGIFMNVKANQAILALPEVESLFVFPSCGDETNSIGAAYAYYARKRIEEGHSVDIGPLNTVYWGREYSDYEIEAALHDFCFTKGKPHWHESDDIESQIAQLLVRGVVVARFKGPMEFGARALGNRSILANAARPGVVQRINQMIKARDFWMPFAPSMLAEYSDEYLCKPKPARAPYMIMSFDTVTEKREQLIAAIHPQDGTARPQEVYPGDNPDYEAVLRYFQEATGEGVILNTSFNLHGHPLVYSPQDALKVFDRSGLEYMALGNYLVSKGHEFAN